MMMRAWTLTQPIDESPGWSKRAASPADERFIVDLWLRSFARTPLGARLKDIDHRRYWRNLRAEVLLLLERAETTVLCDPVAPDDIVWAFACCSPDVVHFAAVKPAFMPHKLAMLSDLLGERTAKQMYYTHVIPDVLPMPRAWIYDPHCLVEIVRGGNEP